jgi:molecular chaperone HscA
VGIDLGTTHSLVAAVRHGVAECLPDAQGRVLLPSVVRYLAEGRRQIGHDAHAAQASDPRTPSPRSSASWAAAWPTWPGP